MLEDQVFTKPIMTVIGPELFWAENPMRMDISVLQQFARVICPAAMFKFYYLAFLRSRRYENQQTYVKGLLDYGLNLDPILIDHQTTNVSPETHRMIAELVQAADVTYPTEVVKAFGIRGRQEYSMGVSRFLQALTVQVQSTAAFDWELFKNWN